MPHLYFVWKEPGQEDKVLVWDTQTLAVGRAPENDLVPEDDEVSRKHAHFEKSADGYTVGDYRTGNGTFVNAKRVSQKARIQPGDTIAIGKLTLELKEVDDHPAKLGMRLEYASQMKTVGAMPGNSDANATVLGLGDSAPPEDDFVIEPERGSGERAFVVGEEGEAAFQMADLDDSLNEMDLELDEGFELSDPVDAPSPPATQPLDVRPTADPNAQSAAGDPMERMRKLKTLHEEGLITDAEFQEKRAKILEAM